MNSRKIAGVLEIALCAAVAVVIGTLHAEYNEIDTAFPMSGPTDFIAEAGVTNVYTGLISGTGPAVIKGGGTVAFSHANNTYTGGTRVENAVFRLDADGCAGSGAITAAVNTAHIYMNCANVPNDLYFEAVYGTAPTAVEPGYFPVAGAHPLFPLVSPVTVSGEVHFKNTTKYIPGSSKISRKVTFEKDVLFEKGNASHVFHAYGESVFNGRVCKASGTSHFSFGGASSAQGNLTFNCSSNQLWSFRTYNANVKFNAVDCFPDTLFYIANGSAGAYCIFDVNGNDQTLRGFVWNHDSDPPSVGKTSGGYRFRTPDGKPATMRITGHNYTPNGATTPYKLKLALSGPLTLVYDIKAGNIGGKAFYQEFADRLSETTGDLIISNGDFRVSGTASFPNVPNIYVGVGGAFTNSSTEASAFAGCTNLTVLGKMACTGDATPFGDATMALTLGSDAEFSLPVGATATVKSLVVGGVTMPDDTYGDGGTPLAQIKQGSVVVRSGNLYVDCVSGNDANDGTVGRPFKTIKAATDNALDGDVIHVAPGTYGDAEGLPQQATAASKIGTRVVIPENVTIESTDGPEVTFIVGAAATGGQIDNATYGTGTNAVRCVYAKDGSTLRGFTLMGGRAIGVLAGNGGSWTIDHAGAAFSAASSLGATIENCIVSNNIAYVGTIYTAVVKNCIVVGNRGLRGGSSAVSPAGYQCGWYGSIIDGNYGHCTIYAAAAVENCTIGSGNKDTAGTGLPQVLYWHGGGDHAVINTAILGGRFYMGNGAVICCTNCLLVDDSYLNATMRARAYNCIITNSASMKVEANTYRPILGSFLGIDAGEAAYSSDALGDRDIHKTPRVLNGAIDIGAVEYDWRPTFAAALGRRFAMTYASPSVTTNATGGLVVSNGEIAGTVKIAGEFELALAIAGGSLEVYVGGEVVASAAAGDQVVKFSVPDTATEVRIVFTPDAQTPGSVVLKRLLAMRGFVLTYR